MVEAKALLRDKPNSEITNETDDNTENVTEHDEIEYEEKSAYSFVVKLSVGQLLCGVICWVCQILVTVFNDVHLGLDTFNVGWLCGTVFILASSLGIFISYYPINWCIKLFLLSNILAAVSSFIYFLVSCCLLVDILWYQELDGYAESNFSLLKLFLSTQIVISVLELSLSSTSASLSCRNCHYNSTFDNSYVHLYPAGLVKWFSWLQMVSGLCSILFFIILVIISFDARHTLTFEEVYCGFVFLGVGYFGLYTVKHSSISSVTPFMVLNIFSFLFAGILFSLAIVRIYLFDKVHEQKYHFKQNDLTYFQSLNCTKDVIQDRFQDELTPPSWDVIQTKIRLCEKLKIEAVNDAEDVMTRGSGSYGAPRTIFVFEIGLAIFQAIVSLFCAAICCRSSCCVEHSTEEGKDDKELQYQKMKCGHPSFRPVEVMKSTGRNLEDYHEYRK